MFKSRSLLVWVIVLVGCCTFGIPQSAAAYSTEIRLRLPEEISDTALSGRVYVMFDRNVYAHPIEAEMPGESSAWFATNVSNWKPGTDFVLAGKIDSYPYKLEELPEGDYSVQAVFDVNTTERAFVGAPGNIYSSPLAALIRGDGDHVVSIHLDHVYERTEVQETGFIKEIKIQSRPLSDYLKKPTFVKAMVVLPPSYFDTPKQEYATVFVLPGFGSGYTEVLKNGFQIRRYGMNSVGREKVFVFMDQECPLGCHVFTNSDNNGPWATAFVEEFIPFLEKSYRVYRDPSTRFLTGQSSGAWAGLWLQVNYPNQFGGVWACSPDPVDFQSFIGVNIYKSNANMLFDDKGNALELNKLFSDVDRVMGDGWALSTFEAVFSPKGDDGRPLKLWDRDTGVIDPDVAKTWKKYDLRLILQDNWEVLGPKLAGKIHIYVADDDPYGLDNPVRLLMQAMADTDNDMEIVIAEAGGHNLWSDEVRQHIHQGMDEHTEVKHPASDQ